MATLKIEITAPNAAFNNYADDLGYNPIITTGFTPEGEPITEANPQNKQQYLVEKIKGIVSTALAAKTADTIQRTKTEEARTEIINNRVNIENAMTVTIT